LDSLHAGSAKHRSFLVRDEGVDCQGPLAWEYDRIGNRLSETRSGIADTYSYAPNAGLPPGHTALLDAIALAGGSGGARDYTFGPAGHLELWDAGANVLDFGNDLSGQLASVTRTAEHAASFRYDGRGYLRETLTLEPGSGGGEGELPFLDGFETGDLFEWSTVEAGARRSEVIPRTARSPEGV